MTRIDPDLKKFEEAALSSFARLSRYGFRYMGSQFLLPDLYVRFRNATTDVTLNFEVGLGAWVELGRLALIAGEQQVEESYHIRYLLAERAPNEQWEYRCALDDRGLPAAIERLGMLVDKYAGDILAGNFSVFPSLKLKWFHDFAIYELRFLQALGFVYFKTDFHFPRIAIFFRSENVEVTLSYEIGSHPRVELSLLASIEGRKEKMESHDLDLILKERAPHERYEQRFNLLDGGMRYGVLRLAMLLEEYAQDVLRGDFTAFRTLKAT